MIILNIIIYFFVLIINYKVINVGGVHYNEDKNVVVLPMKKLKRNLELIKEDCGEVCDTSDNFVKKPGLYFDKIVKNINQNIQQQMSSKLLETTTKNLKLKKSTFLFACITGPALPYSLSWSAMAESPDGRGVLLFGGYASEDSILELRAGANSWNILNITLENGREGHVVIPLQ